MTDAPPPAHREIDWVRVIVYTVALCIVFAIWSSQLPISKVQLLARRAEAKSAVTQLVGAMKQFTIEYGFPPTGTNAQIIAALQGDNPRKVVFFECKSTSIDTLGAFLDPWHTPYRIDTTNPAFPWAYSFGKDKQDNGGAAGSDDVASWQ